MNNIKLKKPRRNYCNGELCKDWVAGSNKSELNISSFIQQTGAYYLWSDLLEGEVEAWRVRGEREGRDDWSKTAQQPLHKVGNYPNEKR